MVIHSTVVIYQMDRTEVPAEAAVRELAQAVTAELMEMMVLMLLIVLTVEVAVPVVPVLFQMEERERLHQ